MNQLKTKLFRRRSSIGFSFPDPPTSESPDSPAPIVFTSIDFPAYGLPEYAHRTAFVIDNLFTPADCQRLLEAAESKSEWVPAKLNGGGNLEYSDTSYRNSGRIMHDDEPLAEWIFEKLRPYLGGIEFIADAKRHNHLRAPSAQTTEGAQLLRLNERLRFLRYGPGEFFKPHADGSYVTPDRKQVSYYTLQIYLNGDKDSLKGGATRFWPTYYSMYSASKSNAKKEIHYVDVESRMGRVLIFEHEGLLHSGEEVKEGVKYSMRTDFMYVEKEPEPVEDLESVSPFFVLSRLTSVKHAEASFHRTRLLKRRRIHLRRTKPKC